MKRKLIFDGNLSIGSWITLGHPAIAEIMADAGFDWLAIDLEHSAITIREAEDLIRVIDLKGVAPFIRLTSNNPEQIKRVMDAGAHGIIVPMVNTSEAARAAVAAVKYPPQGARSFGLARAQRYGNRFEEYLAWQSSGSMVVVQIEHIEAVENIDAILAVDGVDGYFVGPYDLSGSLGRPGQFEHPVFIDAMKRIKEAGDRMNKPGGVHIIEPDESELRKRISEGNQFIAFSLDVRILDATCRSTINKIKKDDL